MCHMTFNMLLSIYLAVVVFHVVFSICDIPDWMPFECKNYIEDSLKIYVRNRICFKPFASWSPASLPFIPIWLVIQQNFFQVLCIVWYGTVWFDTVCWYDTVVEYGMVKTNQYTLPFYSCGIAWHNMVW